ARRLLFTEAVDHLAGLAQARGQTGEVAVTGHQAETVEGTGVQQIHGVDDHGAVGRVLAAGVGELLDRLQRVLQQAGLPFPQSRRGPVAVDALDAGDTETGHLRQQTLDDRRIGVVRVDQNRQAVALAVAIHRLPPFRYPASDTSPYPRRWKCLAGCRAQSAHGQGSCRLPAAKVARAETGPAAEGAGEAARILEPELVGNPRQRTGWIGHQAQGGVATYLIQQAFVAGAMLTEQAAQ